MVCPQACSQVLTPDVSPEPPPHTFLSFPVFLWFRLWAGAGQSQASPGLGAVWRQEAVLSGAWPPEPAGTLAAVTTGTACAPGQQVVEGCHPAVEDRTERPRLRGQ